MKNKPGIETTAPAAHTPGPWITYGGTITADDKLAPGYTVEICRVSNLNDNVKHPGNEVASNARLIAAAPETAAERDRLREVNADLLAACEAIVRLAHRTEMDTRPIDGGAICHLAWDAISKAKAL